MVSQAKFNRKIIIQNILTLFFSSSITQGITALMLILTARQVGPEQYGQYSSSMTLVTFLSILFSLGLNLWLLDQGGGDPENIDSLMGSVILIKITFGTIWLLAIFLIAPLIQRSTLPSNLVRLAAIAIFTSDLFSTVITSFKSLLRNKINAALEIISSSLQFILTLGLIAWGVTNIYRYLGYRTIVIGIFAALSLGLAWKFIRFKPSRKIARTALKEFSPFAASEFLAWLYMRVDLLIIAIRLDEFSAGIYSLSVGIINTLFFIPNAVGYVILPVLSGLFKTNIRQAWLTTGRSLLLFGVIGVVLTLSIFPLAEIITFIMGPAYQSTTLLLKIMSPILLFKSLNFGLGSLLVAAKKQKQRSFVQLIAVLINVILNLSLITRTGVFGVAIVYLVTEGYLLIGYALLAFHARARSPLGLPTNI